MEGLGFWCKSATAVSVILSVLSFIIPDGKTKRIFSDFAAMIMIFSLLYPLSDIKNAVLSVKASEEISFSEKDDFDSYTYSALIEAAEDETEKFIIGLTKKADMSCTCSVRCSSDGETILFKEIKIDGTMSDGDKEYIICELNEITDKDTLIYFNGEKYG